MRDRLELTLSPSGQLLPEIDGLPLDVKLSDMGVAFPQETPEGLLVLTEPSWRGPVMPSVAFWREFANRYLTVLCHTPDVAAHADLPIHEPDEATCQPLIDSAPPMKGLEYLTPDVLRRLWVGLDKLARQKAVAHREGPAGFLAEKNPAWKLVGRVTFHLAENKKNSSYPFAFLATYTSRLSHDSRPQYLPLSKALQEYAGAKNKPALINLLTPVQRSAEKSTLIRELVDASAIYQPQVWTPRQAYRFLKDIPLFEESGVIVRIPDWWKPGSSSRPKVTIHVREKKESGLGLDALLDFSANLTLDGQDLTPEEWQQLREASENLVYLRGRWVEVDATKLEQLLQQWKVIEGTVRKEGLTFAEGMRLLSGVSLGIGEEMKLEEVQQWFGVTASGRLKETLDQLRSPAKIDGIDAGSLLKADLRPYQKVGVNWLHFMSRLGLGSCLADDMGLGKTIQVLALLLVRRREGLSGPNLLVAPASLLANWKAEIQRFAPSLVLRFAHTSEEPQTDWTALCATSAQTLNECDLIITSYGMMARIESLTSVSWQLVILDEAQAIKNAGARQTRAVKKLQAQTRIVLTGTPVENRLGDLWSLFDFLNPGLLGSAKTFSAYVKQLAGQTDNPYGGLRSLVRPYILRRLKTDKSVISDLPDKTEVRAYCSLTPAQAALYERAVRELAERLENTDGIQRRGLVLAAIMRFKQICNHPAHGTGDGDFDPGRSGKFKRLREIGEEIAARQERVLVFTQFQEIMDPLVSFLATIFTRNGLQLHGGTPVRRRRELVETFQAEDGPPYFVLSLKAGGTGLNLTAATHVIHFDRWWNPAVENQATDRAYRIGQKRNVLVHKFVSRGTIEEKIDQLIEEKISLARDLLDEEVGARLLTEMSNKELLKFVALDIHGVASDE